MKLQQIELNEEELPSSAMFRVSADEALYLAVLLGGMSGSQAEELLNGGSHLAAELYKCLAGNLFNRFYEGGVEEACRLHG